MTASNAHVDLPPRADSPENARRITESVLRAWSVPVDRHTDIVLLVSEVVSNAVEHAGGASSLQLTLSHSEETLRVALTDGSSIQPTIRALDHNSHRGRGMQLIEVLSDRWGVEDHHGGKTVWFTLTVAA